MIKKNQNFRKCSAESKSIRSVQKTKKITWRHLWTAANISSKLPNDHHKSPHQPFHLEFHTLAHRDEIFSLNKITAKPQATTTESKNSEINVNYKSLQCAVSNHFTDLILCDERTCKSAMESDNKMFQYKFRPRSSSRSF